MESVKKSIELCQWKNQTCLNTMGRTLEFYQVVGLNHVYDSLRYKESLQGMHKMLERAWYIFPCTIKYKHQDFNTVRICGSGHCNTIYVMEKSLKHNESRPWRH